MSADIKNDYLLITVGALGAQLVTAAQATPVDLSTIAQTVVTLAEVLGAPDWVLDGLKKVATVGVLTPSLIGALNGPEPDVQEALEVVVQMAAGVPHGEASLHHRLSRPQASCAASAATCSPRTSRTGPPTLSSPRPPSLAPSPSPTFTQYFDVYI